MEEEKKEKKKLNTLDKYIILCLTVLILYTIAHSVIFAFTGQESKVLDTLVFTAFSGEVIQCYFIKKGKLNKEMEFMQNKKKENDSDVDEPFTDDM